MTATADQSSARTTSHALLGGIVRFTRAAGDPETALVRDDFAAHAARFGPRPVATGRGAQNLIARFEQSDLTGRGGGHYAVASKWRSHLAAGGDGLVVANASESEPASAKDAALLHLRPHLVLDGLVLAAEAIGATKAVVWMHENAIGLRDTVSRALAERTRSSLAEPEIRIVTGPHHYLSGESSAIANSLSGGPALPQFRRDPTARLTVNGQRVLVHNVETLAQIAVVARTSIADHRPTTLITVTERDRRTVVEVAPSTALTAVVSHVLDERGAGAPHAVLVGGYGGQWVAWNDLAGLAADDHALADHGLSMGAGVMLPLLAGQCGIRKTHTLAKFLADSSAHQCGPCMFGLRAVADVLGEAAELNRSRKNLKKLQRYLAEIAGRGGCNHPDGAVRMVSSALRVFADDLDAHLSRGECRHQSGGS